MPVTCELNVFSIVTDPCLFQWLSTRHNSTLVITELCHWHNSVMTKVPASCCGPPGPSNARGLAGPLHLLCPGCSDAKPGKLLLALGTVKTATWSYYEGSPTEYLAWPTNSLRVQSPTEGCVGYCRTYQVLLTQHYQHHISLIYS